MLWWGVVLVIVAGATARALFVWQPFGKRQTRHQLEHGVKGLLILKENGGWLDIMHRGSPFRLRIYRESGDDSKAEVVVAVPREPWSEPKLADLVELFERHGLSHATDSDPRCRRSSLVQAHLTIPYIWTNEVGAKPAHVAHLVLDLWGLGASELFDLRLEGASSSRWKKHRDKLANV